MSKKLVALTAITALFGAGPALAHHSFAMFDNAKTVTVQGTVQEWQWTNPHSWINVAVTGSDGKTTMWPIEGQSPNILIRQGWSANVLKAGDKVSVALHPLKSGAAGGSVVSVTLADGKVLGRPPGA